jgi:uncharacterized protein (TIGR03083 family)
MSNDSDHRPGAGQLYAAARASISELVRSLSSDQLALDVPTCPGWTVQDVVAHLAGLATDAVNEVPRTGSIDEWTAKHVSDRRKATIDEVLSEWDQSSVLFEPRLDEAGNRLPTAVMDAVAHEHDIRGALNLPGNRDDPAVLASASLFSKVWSKKIDQAGLAPIGIAGGSSDGQSVGRYEGSPFELFRAAFGRRSQRQIEAEITGVDDASAYADLVYVFGPSPLDIVE